jgi:hypothetical protein
VFSSGRLLLEFEPSLHVVKRRLPPFSRSYNETPLAMRLLVVKVDEHVV